MHFLCERRFLHCIVSVLVWRDTHYCKELPQEVFIVDISAFFSNLGHTHGSHCKAELSFCNTCRNAIFMDAYSEAFFIDFAQMSRTVCIQSLQLFRIKAVLWVHVNMASYTEHFPVMRIEPHLGCDALIG